MDIELCAAAALWGNIQRTDTHTRTSSQRYGHQHIGKVCAVLLNGVYVFLCACLCVWMHLRVKSSLVRSFQFPVQFLIYQRSTLHSETHQTMMLIEYYAAYALDENS